MRRFIVTGPEYLHFEHVPGIPEPGPNYPVRDVFLVDAINRQAARWAAWRRARELNCEWPDRHAGDGLHPLSGVTVEPVPDDEAAVETPEVWGPLYVDALSERKSA